MRVKLKTKEEIIQIFLDAGMEINGDFVKLIYKDDEVNEDDQQYEEYDMTTFYEIKHSGKTINVEKLDTSVLIEEMDSVWVDYLGEEWIVFIEGGTKFPIPKCCCISLKEKLDKILQ